MGNEHMLYAYCVLDTGAFSFLIEFHSHNSPDIGTHPCFSGAEVWTQRGEEMCRSR